jgi:hypothetical protein
MKTLLIAGLVTALSVAQASAQSTKSKKAPKEGETAIKIEDVSGKKNKVSGDIDEEITNAKLRAESGSKSKWSGSIAASYSGGSLEEPFSKNRPNPTNDPIPPRVTLGGDMNVRYRMDKNQSLTAGVGFSLERPLHEAERGDVTNPNVSYNYVGKLGTVQSVASAGVTVTTDSDQIEAGSLGTVSAGETLMYDVGSTKLSLGLAGEAYYTQYTKDKDKMVHIPPDDPAPAGAYQEDYGFAAYPLMEYAISDKVQLRTVFRPWIFNHRAFQEGSTFTRRPWTQSFGVGFAVTRDIYLYPNFQWNVERWRRNGYDFTDKDVRSVSTVGLSATINVF